jgi:hypothetical protein
MESLTDLLKVLLLGAWAVDMFTILMLFHLWQKTGEVSSSLITMTIVTIVMGFIIGYESALLAYTEVNPEPSQVVNFLWYMGLMGFYIAVLWFIHKLHHLSNMKIGTAGQLASNACLGLGLIQIAQYIEIVLFKTNHHMDTLYTVGIPAINIATTLVCFYLAVYALYYLVYKKEKREALRWHI